jgi:hypothetical protein
MHANAGLGLRSNMEQLMPSPISPIENGSEAAAAATDRWRSRIHLQ